MTSRSTDTTLGGMHPSPRRVNGWWLLSWRDFQAQVASLVEQAERLAQKDPSGYRSHPAVKMLFAIVRLTTRDIPADPGHENFRLGSTLGGPYRAWRRAKFYQRFRLFFRYDSRLEVIVYAWVNSESGLRKSGDRNDPYAVFLRMLARGQPPDDIEQLLAERKPLQFPDEIAGQ